MSKTVNKRTAVTKASSRQGPAKSTKREWEWKRPCPQCSSPIPRAQGRCEFCGNESAAWVFRDGYWWVGQGTSLLWLDEEAKEWKNQSVFPPASLKNSTHEAPPATQESTKKAETGSPAAVETPSAIAIPRMPKRTMAIVASAVMALMALIVGIAIGGSGKVDQSELSALRVAADKAAGEAERKLGEAQRRIANADSRAQVAAERRLSDRATNAESKAKARELELDKRSQALDAHAAELDRREAELNQRTAAIDASSFGDGVWEVGVDIQPGKYKAVGSETCYWAKLRENDDIIDNHLGSGPVTVTIDPSVNKFESQGCGTWNKA
jgi:hypothetical protein